MACYCYKYEGKYFGLFDFLALLVIIVSFLFEIC